MAAKKNPKYDLPSFGATRGPKAPTKPLGSTIAPQGGVSKKFIKKSK